MMRYIIGVVLIALAATFFYNKVYIPKITFETIKPSVGKMNVTVSGIGNVGAKNIYNITAQSGGKILELLSDEGEWVTKGDLLIVMDGVDLNEQLEVAHANLTKARYELVAAKSEFENQNAQMALLEVTYNRYLKLKNKNFASQSEFDKANTDLQSSKANVSSSLSHINSAKAGISIAEKSIKVVEAKINRLKVYAPIDGYVISKEAEVSQNILPSSSIFQIVDPKTLWIKAKIDERMSAEIRLGQSAMITLRSQEKKPLAGKVKRVVSISDAVTFEREIDVAFETTPKLFFMNEQAEVKITLNHYDNVIKIPSMVVVKQNGELGVWIVRNYHVEFKAIEIVAQSDDEVAISNIAKSTQILVPNKGKKTLKNGMKIHL